MTRFLRFSNDLDKTRLGASIILLVFFLLELFLRIYENQVVFYIWAFLGYLSFYYCFSIKGFKLQQLALIIILLIFMLLSSLVSRNIEILGIFFNLQYIGIALLIVTFKTYHKVVITIMIIYFLFFAYQFTQDVDLNTLFVTSSRNHISTVILSVVILYYVSGYMNNKTLRILPAIFALTIGVWSMSRAGIVALGLMLSSIVTIKIYKWFTGIILGKVVHFTLRSLLIFFFKLVTIILGMYILIDYGYLELIYDNLESSFMSLIYRFYNEGLSSTSRESIILNYFTESMSDYKNLLFGVNLGETTIFAEFENNLHNSFLTAHAYYGVFGFLTIIMLIVVTSLRFLKNRNILFFSLFIVLIVRSLTDIVAFPGYLDVMIYFFILFALQPNDKFTKEGRV